MTKKGKKRKTVDGLSNKAGLASMSGRTFVRAFLSFINLFFSRHQELLLLSVSNMELLNSSRTLRKSIHHFFSKACRQSHVYVKQKFNAELEEKNFGS